MTPRTVYLARELDRARIPALLGAGRIERVRRGAFARVTATAVVRAASSSLPGSGYAPGSPTTAGSRQVSGSPTTAGGRTRERAIEHITAVHRQLRAPHVFSHLSAALLWDLPVWTLPTATSLRQASKASGRRSRDIARYTPLPASWAVRRSLPTTTLAQTVVDCAMTLPPHEGLVVLDGALRAGLRPDDAREALTATVRLNGRARAARLLDLADGGAESAWESYVRYLCHAHGFPRPTTQVAVTTRLGTYRVDLGWPEHGVYLEFDGRVKYRSGAFGPGHDAEAVLIEEKRREDALTETLGMRPLRVMATDLRDVPGFVARLAALFPPSVRATLRTTPTPPL